MADQAKPDDGGSKPQVCDLMVTNGYVLSMDARRTVYPGGAVAIDGTRIAGVGTARDMAQRFKPRRTIDAGGAAVHPGFIDGHYHCTLHLSRGGISDNPHPAADPDAEAGPGAYVVWINALEDEDEYASTLMASVEMVRNGFTAFMDPGTVFEPDAAAAAVEDVGIRAVLADPYIWDLEGSEPESTHLPRARPNRKRAEQLLGRELARNKNPDALVRGHVAVYGIGTVSDELALAAKGVADAAKVTFAAHQNFMAGDVDHDTRRLGRHPLVHFGEIGLLGPNTAFTHMNVIHDDEVKPVVESGMSIVWHPGNYLYYGVSQQMKTRMPSLWKQGTQMTFGTDVAKVWAFGELGWLAYLVSREIGHYLPSEAILEMFTIGGAKVLGLQDELGSLEPGKRADIVIRSNDLPDQQPNLDIVRQIALVSRTKSVDTVICNGEIVVRKGCLTRLDEAAVYARASASADAMVKRTGLPVGTYWPQVT